MKVNALLKALAHEAETVGLRRHDLGILWKTNGTHPNQGRSGLRWLKATIRTIDSRRDALQRAHWKKIWRSMAED
jgi:hypothetical protein